MSQWYVAHCQPNGEQKALFHLRRQGYEAYLPVYKKQRRHARRVDHVMAPLFPRYLFIRLELGVDHWRPIRSTVGISHFVCQGERPVAVPDGIVESIQAREDNKGCVALNEAERFKKGDPVQLAQGPLSDQVALFDRIADDQRVVVLLELLGRPVEVRVAKDAISAVA